MGSAQTLREVERALQAVVLPLEGSLVAALTAPHAQADLDRLLQHLETLPLRREGYPESARLFFVVARADAEPGAALGEDVQRGHRLCQDGRVTEMHPRNHRSEHGPLRVGGQKRQGRVALRFVRLRSPHYRMLPDVVRDADAVETSLFRGPTDVR